MAEGDLITRDGQYEFNGLLLNSSWLIVENEEGLMSAGAYKVIGDSEMLDTHGGKVGRDMLTRREVVLDLGLDAALSSEMHSRLREVNRAFQPQPDLKNLIFQKAGFGKMMLPVRPRRIGGFRADHIMSWGTSRGSVLLVAPDPRLLSFAQSSQAITIASEATQAQASVTMGGNFLGGAPPVLEIAGPATNPRITNVLLNRTIRLDLVISSGQTLIIDTSPLRRSVTMGGVDQFGTVRNDNQWWVLQPGAQTISWTRSNAPASTATLTVRWRNAWI